MFMSAIVQIFHELKDGTFLTTLKGTKVVACNSTDASVSFKGKQCIFFMHKTSLCENNRYYCIDLLFVHTLL